MATNTSQGLEALMSTGTADQVPATVSNASGQPVGTAALSEGEFVFSVPAIIALGEGDYDAGLAALEEIHNQLRTQAEEFVDMSEQPAPAASGLAAV